MPKGVPKNFKSDVLMRKIDKLVKAAEAHAFRGAHSEYPNEVKELEENLRKARLDLVTYVIEHVL
ncbi:hypothetical protein EVC27_030 [Rhizobium phage RHph_I1_6]|uniref:Uncharacterized protein n=1 Tax=Rhizobium phage RHph_I1_6 TaxID=2509728 RepID=A0A7S5RJP2_9CAUD|nr:hypothetical protein PP745_gp030 [Rhizobium phage RHph_I1_6]QIG76555.1 hypothetical protein EVC27_030 [Rhizobium phage RHph_I1_6]